MRVAPDLSGLRAAIHAELKRGGFLKRLDRPELSKLRGYLDALPAWRPGTGDPQQQPTLFPPYPGLDERPWREREDVPSALALEKSAAAISQELAALESSPYFLDYAADIVKAGGTWSVLPLYFLGERIMADAPLTATAAAVHALPDHCASFPLADVLLSAHAPGTHLTPHCSWDGFRMRLHLGLKIPPRCRMRVANETREWSEGRALIFHDAFEHETWNDGPGRRTILIVDCWHPGLSMLEREALTAGLRKSEVRSLLLQLRDPGEALSAPLRASFKAGDRDALIARYWASA